MNEVLLSLGLASLKTYLVALLLPPMPLLALNLAGAWLLVRGRRIGWLLLAASLLALWWVATPVAGAWLAGRLVAPTPPLDAPAIAALRQAPRTTVVVLGAGRPAYAPEYGGPSLKPEGIERLRYGLWLAAQTGLPLGFSGGLAGRAPADVAEADLAALTAQREFGRTLDWTENRSRDSREHALQTLALLAPMGIERIVLVTHDSQMARAVLNFRRAADGRPLDIVAAPVGAPDGLGFTAHGWIPSPRGFETSWLALHEWLGRLGGA